MPPRIDPAHPALPARYLDPRPIGSGGMGEIFRATDRELGRDVAIKLLARRFADDAALRGRFEREALAAARLSGTPNVVTIFDVGEHDGRPMIVMEYLPGGSVEERARAGSPIPQRQIVAWLEQTAGALDAAHSAGIVHRDVKPGNLLLDARGAVHVADFGIASAAGLNSFTQTGTILGTAGYLSPEQARGERATAASDRYALAVVAWELLAERRPFESNVVTVEAAAHIDAPIPSIHAARPGLPRALDAVFARALAKDPRARYPSAAAFVDALQSSLLGDRATTVMPTTVTRILPPRTSRRWWIPVLAALLLAAGAIAAVLATRSDTQPSARTVVHTATHGKTVRQTVTSQPPPQASGLSGTAANNAGYAKLRARDYAGALPLLQQAVAKLSGSGSLDEAYADYNLALTEFALGQCTDVLALLDRSQQIQGKRPPIDDLRRQAEQRCTPARGPGKSHGKHRGHG
ncbi:MAG TPA: serine/threonine-protein kinase [Gaiellaceae bacterium]